MTDPFTNRLKLISGQEPEATFDEEDSSPDAINFNGQKYQKEPPNKKQPGNTLTRTEMRTPKGSIGKTKLTVDAKGLNIGSQPLPVITDISWSASKPSWWRFRAAKVSIAVQVNHGCGLYLTGPPRSTAFLTQLLIKPKDVPEAHARVVLEQIQRASCIECGKTFGLFYPQSQSMLLDCVADIVERFQKKDRKK